MSNARRLRMLRALIEAEGPVDGIHNEAVHELFTRGGSCPRYLGCTSEGSRESNYRDNPDFFAGDLGEVARWLGSSFAEGWAANWVCDLDHPRAPRVAAQLDWSVIVQLPASSSTPTVLGSGDLLLAASQVLLEQRHSLASAEVVEVVNRALGRSPAERRQTRELISASAGGA